MATKTVKNPQDGPQAIVTAEYGITERGYFAITGEMKQSPQSREPYACGCIHDDIAKLMPELAELIPYHLANARDGLPMHYVENGLYWRNSVWRAGRYHDDQKTPAECAAILRDHIRYGTVDGDTTVTPEHMTGDELRSWLVSREPALKADFDRMMAKHGLAAPVAKA